VNDADVFQMEYTQLKTEQTGRLQVRDNLVYATLISLGTVGGFIVQSGNINLILAIPAPVLVLGWLYLANDRMIASMRVYVRDDLRHRLAEAISRREAHVGAADLLRWEAQPRERWLTLWRSGGLILNLALFIAPAVGALSVWAAQWNGTANILIGAWLLEALATAGVLLTVIVNAAKRNPIHPGAA
jgi:muconolactone delta-isomerase